MSEPTDGERHQVFVFMCKKQKRVRFVPAANRRHLPVNIPNLNLRHASKITDEASSSIESTSGRADALLSRVTQLLHKYRGYVRNNALIVRRRSPGVANVDAFTRETAINSQRARPALTRIEMCASDRWRRGILS